MDIKELEDIVSQLSSEVSKTSTSFSSFLLKPTVRLI